MFGKDLCWNCNNTIERAPLTFDRKMKRSLNADLRRKARNYQEHKFKTNVYSNEASEIHKVFVEVAPDMIKINNLWKTAHVEMATVEKDLLNQILPHDVEPEEYDNDPKLLEKLTMNTDELAKAIVHITALNDDIKEKSLYIDSLKGIIEHTADQHSEVERLNKIIHEYEVKESYRKIMNAESQRNFQQRKNNPNIPLEHSPEDQNSPESIGGSQSEEQNSPESIGGSQSDEEIEQTATQLASASITHNDIVVD